MTACCNWLTRLFLVLYIGIHAYTIFQDVDTHGDQFMVHYKNFQETFARRAKMEFPAQMTHSNIEHHGACVAKYLSYALLGLGILSLLVCRKLTMLLGLVYFLEELVVQNFVSLTQESTLEELQRFALALFILFSSCYLSRCLKNEESKCVASRYKRSNNLNESRQSNNNRQSNNYRGSRKRRGY